MNSKKQGELYFVIEQDGDVIPVEVKSGKNYERHNALKNVMGNADYDIRQAYVLCNGNVEEKGHVCYVPVLPKSSPIRKHRISYLLLPVVQSGLL